MFDPDAVAAIDIHTHAEEPCGSDWPAITPDRRLSDFETLNIKEEVKPLILKENARKVLGI